MNERNKTTVGTATLGSAIVGILAIALDHFGVKLATAEVAMLIPGLNAIITFLLPHDWYERLRERGLNGKRD